MNNSANFEFGAVHIKITPGRSWKIMRQHEYLLTYLQTSTSIQQRTISDNFDLWLGLASPDCAGRFNKQNELVRIRAQLDEICQALNQNETCSSFTLDERWSDDATLGCDSPVGKDEYIPSSFPNIRPREHDVFSDGRQKGKPAEQPAERLKKQKMKMV